MSRIVEFLGKRVDYDPDSGYFLLEDYSIVLEIRGWAQIGKLCDNNLARMNEFQSELGVWVADAINQKLDKANDG